MVMTNKDLDVKATPELIKVRHRMIKDVTTRFEQFSLNTVVSAFMEYNNKLMEFTKNGGVDKETLQAAVIMIAPFAPHLGEELWEQLGGAYSVFHQEWPAYDDEAMKDTEIELPVQINGKTRGTVMVAVDASKDEILAKAKEVVADKLTGTIVKEIYVPGKIINIVQK